MTKIETMGVMAILKAAYPMYYKDKSKEELTSVINLWTELFADDDINLIKAAVKRHIATDTKGFPPVIGQIKQSLVKIVEPNELSEQEAWNLVSKAIRNSAYNATEEYEKLPELVKQIVTPLELREWAQIEKKETMQVVASNFMRSYSVKLSSNREYQALPNDIKKLVSNSSPMIEGNKNA